MMSFIFLIVMLGVIMLIVVTPIKHEPEPRIRFGEFSTLEMALGSTDTMHLLCSIVTPPNLELKTRPKQLLVCLPLAFEFLVGNNAKLFGIRGI